MTLQIQVKNGSSYSDLICEDGWSPARFRSEFAGIPKEDYHKDAHGLYCVELLDDGEFVDGFYTYQNPAI